MSDSASKQTKQNKAPGPEERFQGCLIGAALGEAAGLAVRYLNPREILLARGDFPGPPRDCSAQISFLGIMRMTALKSLLLSRGFKGEDQAGRLVKALKDPPRDADPIVIKAMENLSQGADWREAGLKSHASQTNTCLDRIMPAALCYAGAGGWSVRVADEAVRITHGHEQCRNAARVLAQVVSDLAEGKPFEAGPEYSEVDVIPSTFVWASVRHALAALTRPDFASGLEWVVDQGGSSDVNGALAGALLGLRYGIEGIPLNWLVRLKEADYMKRAGLELLEINRQLKEAVKG